MRILDLFCKAGGAAMGYHQAGFEIVGVDIEPQPNYPFDFFQSDALRVLDHGAFNTLDWIPDVDQFDAIHASPPCQCFTMYGNTVKDVEERYEDLVEPTRKLLKETELPYIIENVPRSPLVNPTILCGSMFEGHGMHDVQRHRLFETNWPLYPPSWCDHSIWPENRFVGGRSQMRGGKDVLCRATMEIGRRNIPLDLQKSGMGVDWKMTRQELSNAVPPAYTKYIGEQLMNYLNGIEAEPPAPTIFNLMGS